MATSKDQLLQYFKTLDVSILERLQKYSQLLIIPDEDLLASANMSQMVDKAHSLADALFPSWTDRSKSDFGEFLVDNLRYGLAVTLCREAFGFNAVLREIAHHTFGTTL